MRTGFFRTRPAAVHKFRTLATIKASGRHYETLQSAILSKTKQPNFTVQDVINRLIEEDDHICNHEAQGFLPTVTALASQTVTARTRTRPLCSHCKRNGHYADFCIQPGGKMAGRTLEEAKAAYRASPRQQRTEDIPKNQPTSANVAVAHRHLSRRS